MLKKKKIVFHFSSDFVSCVPVYMQLRKIDGNGSSSPALGGDTSLFSVFISGWPLLSHNNKTGAQCNTSNMSALVSNWTSFLTTQLQVCCAGFVTNVHNIIPAVLLQWKQVSTTYDMTEAHSKHGLISRDEQHHRLQWPLRLVQPNPKKSSGKQQI